MLFGMEGGTFSVVIATFLGPIGAVIVTRFIDERRAIRNRQMDVFRALMSSRRATLSLERVRALNMVEIEFHGIKTVLEAYRAFMNHLNSTPTKQDLESNQIGKLETRLLAAMAEKLKYRLEQLDVLDGGYYPRGIADIENEQKALRQALIEVAAGRRPLIVSPAAPAPPSPFPAPPPP